MTTIDSRPLGGRSPGTRDDQRHDSRILAVVRLHLVNRYSVFGTPWIIMAGIFAVSLTIWWIIATSVPGGSGMRDAQEGLSYSGAIFYIFVYMLVLGVQAVASGFPFALGFSVTRRDFWLGSTLTFGLLSVTYGLMLTVLAEIETASGGWGLQGALFATVYFGGTEAEWFTRFALYLVAFLFFFFVGSASATIYQRWRMNGMLVLFGGLAVVVIVGIILITLAQSWSAVGAWFVDNGPTGVVLWLIVPTVISAGISYLALRRATPTN